MRKARSGEGGERRRGPGVQEGHWRRARHEHQAGRGSGRLRDERRHETGVRGDTGGEHKMNSKQDEEGDTFVKKGDTDQACEEDTGGASHIGELHSSQIQDTETRHIPGGTWLSQSVFAVYCYASRQLLPGLADRVYKTRPNAAPVFLEDACRDGILVPCSDKRSFLSSILTLGMGDLIDLTSETKFTDKEDGVMAKEEESTSDEPETPREDHSLLDIQETDPRNRGSAS
ncbi:hypothetical protein NDU88_005291 [Pleurodeles waltl]|uniref:Uncharacterized protein n=1 Tax=Pleurodeles waltl TaxID=8319 RepID=A0AAV7NMB3_PLEWA|nr:hypothetical protein NDU88_005291 [Pleurodeles waltl]